MKLLTIILILLSIPYIAMAKEGQPHQKTVNMTLPNFNFVYNFQIKRNDDGLNKDAGNDQGTTTTKLKELRISLSGEAAKNFFYEIELNGANTNDVNTDILDHAEFKYVHNKLSFVIGNPIGSVYGWRQKLDGPMDYTNSASSANSPWGRAAAVQISYDFQKYGIFKLQSAKDTVTSTSYNTKENSNAMTVEWMGTYANFTPLLQYASYDKGHSNTYSAGLRYKNKRFDLRFDFIKDMKFTNASNGKNKLTGINVEGYVYCSVVETFFMYSSFDNKQNGTDTKTNTAGSYDDNKKTYALGLSYLGFNSAFKPYLAFILDTGKFLNQSNAEDTFKEKTITLGVKGSW